MSTAITFDLEDIAMRILSYPDLLQKTKDLEAKIVNLENQLLEERITKNAAQTKLTDVQVNLLNTVEAIRKNLEITI